jgi:hypothetical protein
MNEIKNIDHNRVNSNISTVRIILMTIDSIYIIEYAFIMYLYNRICIYYIFRQ